MYTNKFAKCTIVHTQAKKWNTSNAYFWQKSKCALDSISGYKCTFYSDPFNTALQLENIYSNPSQKECEQTGPVQINFFLAKLIYFPITIQSLKFLFELHLHLLLLVLKLQIKEKFWIFLHLTHIIKIILTFQSLKALSELVLLLLLGLQLLFQASKPIRQLLRMTP